ncbi:YlmH family RNA-binding protein [Virgibacillus sp. MG-45]|uniref:YlmH family RNA-binding protein n=1 Tax=Virgibacillus sp. MG-45 TaxID=3102791 RepID=UPI002ED8112F
MEIYQHFRKEEYPFIDQVLSWKTLVETRFQSRLTDFLDPREQQIVRMLVNSSGDDVTLDLFGGGNYSERKRAVISPYYEEITEESFGVVLLEATYPDKFIQIEHRDVLGAFLSLGVKREKLGDIYVSNGIIQIVLAKEISPFVMTQLTAVKRASIQLHEVSFNQLIEVAPIWEEVSKTISSLRLDNIVKEIYNIPRKQANEYINKQQVKVNFRVVDDAKFLVQPGDILSLRGKGRSKLIDVNGRTKKDKIRITAALLK